MTKKKLRIGALPKRQMPRKSHQSSQPTPRHERSVVKDVVEIPASTSFYSTFQEFSQRAKSLKTICDWMSKFSVDKAVFKKMTEPYMLPQFEIIVDDGLGFTVKVYGCYLVEDHPLYLEYRRSMQNVTMSNLVKDLEGYKLCNGVQTLELTSKLFHHVVPINHDTVSEHEEEAEEEEEQQQFPHKGFWRAKGWFLIQEQGEACFVETLEAGRTRREHGCRLQMRSCRVEKSSNFNVTVACNCLVGVMYIYTCISLSEDKCNCIECCQTFKS